MPKDQRLEQGEAAFRNRIWKQAYALLSAADRQEPLQAANLENLATAAYLIGKHSDSIEFKIRAYNEYQQQGRRREAANCAFWLGMELLLHGERAQGSGWIARAGRSLEHYEHECPEQGFLLIPTALQCMGQGDNQKAYKLFSRVAELGNRHNNANLATLGRLGCGQTLIEQRRISEGTTLLDEAMVAVISDEVIPFVAGIIYCAVIETCQKIFDLSRAREWTIALSQWCNSQPDLVPYRGQCLVRRAEIMQLRGDWTDAMTEIKRACRLLSESTGEPAAGEAFYRQAELYRLRGNFLQAEKNYHAASKWGRKPQPGLALLRLTQGDCDAAESGIRTAEKEVKGIARSKILPAYSEIMIAAGDLPAAKTVVEELSQLAEELCAPYLQALADRARGNILLASGNPQSALEKLREAWKLQKNMEDSYESAKTRVLIGKVCRELKDTDSADMEFDAARWIFQQLGAAADLSAVDALAGNTASTWMHGLTPRELQVLRILSTGKTNREIAGELFISERTVDRHVSNILAKLNIKSRSAATAYAYEHEIV